MPQACDLSNQENAGQPCAKKIKLDEESELKTKSPQHPVAHPGAAVYAAALDGLELADPVAAFFKFCKEREQIRERREKQSAGPWSDDPIFQRGRFLNVFREDDRVTRAILRFVKPVAEAEDLERLLHAIFFARWCNRDSTLDAVSPASLQDPAMLRKELLAMEGPWCNETAYPVGPVSFEGVTYDRIDAATELFPKAATFLLDSIRSADRDVHRATEAINKVFKMENSFPIFMAVIDVAWFRPDLIDPASPVPTGIGAVAFIDRLQRHLGLKTHDEVCAKMMELQRTHWPEAKRLFQPIDVEYLCCECRKYYSYVNGTKTFEGKNVFTPGKSPKA